MGAIVDQLVLGSFSAVLVGSRLFLAVLWPLATVDKIEAWGGESGIQSEENEVLGALGWPLGRRVPTDPAHTMN